jgi:hypothetical protein
MKRYFFLLMTFLFLQCSGSKVAEMYEAYSPDDYLYWSEERKLKWEDFQGEPIESSVSACESFFVNPATAEKFDMFSQVELTAICLFDKKKSWVKKESADDNLLLYNQVLFDIYELHTRMLRKEFAESEFTYKLDEEFHSLFEKNNSALMDEIQKFRRESKLGMEENVVKDWSIKINGRLKELIKYRVIYTRE